MLLVTLQVWASKGAAAAIDVAGALAKVNAAAQQGAYTGPHPSVTGATSLHDPHRGWQGSTKVCLSLLLLSADRGAATYYSCC
jgi:hypothetical protein